jgi:hypothetical protein
MAIITGITSVSIGNGLITSEDAFWLRQRRRVSSQDHERRGSVSKRLLEMNNLFDIQS